MTYAIFRAAGFQYRAELGQVLRLPTLPVESGGTVTFDEVLLGSTDGEVLIGRPTLEGASVRGQVLRHGRADKVIVFKFKRRKNYRRKQGHRQGFTEVRISEIDLGGDRRVSLEAAEQPAPKAPAVKAEAAVETEAPKKKAAARKTAAAKKTTAAKKPTAKKATATKKEPTAKKPSAGAKKAAEGKAGGGAKSKKKKT